VNGKTTSNFTYNTFNGKVTANVNLENGNNTVYIKATNEAGSDSDDTVIKYNKPNRPTNTSQFSGVETPTVKITQPNKSPFFTVNNTQVAILATIKNVKSSRDITFKVNGKTIRNFDYNPSSNAFEGVINLRKGDNKIVITGRNGSKTASDNTTIVYEERTQTYNDGGNKTSTDEGTKPRRPRLGDLMKGKRNKDSETKKSTRKPRGGNE